MISERDFWLAFSRACWIRIRALVAEIDKRLAAGTPVTALLVSELQAVWMWLRAIEDLLEIPDHKRRELPQHIRSMLSDPSREHRGTGN